VLLRRVGAGRIGAPCRVVVLPRGSAASIGIVTVAIGVTTIIVIHMMAVIAIGMVIAVVVETVIIIMTEAVRIIVIEAVCIVMPEAMGIVVIEAMGIVVIEAVRIVVVEPPVTTIVTVRSVVRPHHVPMFFLPLGIQLVVIFAHGGAVVPGIRVASRSHLLEHIAYTVTVPGLSGRRSASAIGKCVVIPAACRTHNCIAGRSLAR
jgi:hypothetical protein